MRPVVVQVVVEGWSYAGRALRAGDLVTMTPLDAAGAHRRGLISLTRPSAAALASASVRANEPPPVEPPVVEARPKGRYRRRDLQAEP